MSDRVGVVTIAHGRAAHLAAQHRSLAAGSRSPDAYVVVAMDDASIDVAEVGGLRREVVGVPSTPDGLPLAAARNAGIDRLVEQGCDTVVVLDVDCLAGRTLVAAYAEACRGDYGSGVLWSGPVTYLDPPPAGGYDLDRLDELDDPHPARPAPAPGAVLVETRPELFWSLSFALGVDAWRATGGFCEDYRGYGGEDTDFARVAQGAGLGFAWLGSARAYHQHHPVSRPPVEHVDDILRNGRLFHARWGAWPMTGWLEGFAELGLVERVGEDWRRTPSS